MCNAVGKRFNDYARIGNTGEFLNELSRSAGIPADLLVYTRLIGPNETRGTWVHPDVAINLGQWLSPKFAVAVARWVREWMTGASKARLPYHLQRYLANRAKVLPTHFSILNEMTLALIAPMEEQGYTLPDHMLPDISEGKLFSVFLRSKGIQTSTMPTYKHDFEDGRVVDARQYPNRFGQCSVSTLMMCGCQRGQLSILSNAIRWRCRFYRNCFR